MADSSPVTSTKPSKDIKLKDNSIVASAQTHPSLNRKDKKDQSVDLINNYSLPLPSHNSSYSSLKPPPEILNLWISNCQNRFASTKCLHRDVLIEMGQILLKSAMCT